MSDLWAVLSVPTSSVSQSSPVQAVVRLSTMGVLPPSIAGSANAVSASAPTAPPVTLLKDELLRLPRTGALSSTTSTVKLMESATSSPVSAVLMSSVAV